LCPAWQILVCIYALRSTRMRPSYINMITIPVLVVRVTHDNTVLSVSLYDNSTCRLKVLRTVWVVYIKHQL